jgi:hypothetical protein
MKKLLHFIVYRYLEEGLMETIIDLSRAECKVTLERVATILWEMRTSVRLT